MIQERALIVRKVEDFVINSGRLKPDLIFVEQSAVADHLNIILPDIRRRLIEITGVDKDTQSLLIFNYSDNFGIRSLHHTIENDSTRVKAGEITARLFVGIKSFWGYQDLMSTENGLQILFTKSKSDEPLDDIFTRN